MTDEPVKLDMIDPGPEETVVLEIPSWAPDDHPAPSDLIGEEFAITPAGQPVRIEKYDGDMNDLRGSTFGRVIGVVSAPGCQSFKVPDDDEVRTFAQYRFLIQGQGGDRFETHPFSDWRRQLTAESFPDLEVVQDPTTGEVTVRDKEGPEGGAEAP